MAAIIHRPRCNHNNILIILLPNNARTNLPFIPCGNGNVSSKNKTTSNIKIYPKIMYAKFIIFLDFFLAGFLYRYIYMGMGVNMGMSCFDDFF